MNRPLHKRTILCVDDSPEMLLICRTILEADGFQVHTAADGAAAMEILSRNSVDAAVIDNRMPGMSGIELAHEIKRRRKDLPILMFSDSGPDPSAIAPINLFLNKQSGPRAMRDAVRTLLAQFSI